MDLDIRTLWGGAGMLALALKELCSDCRSFTNRRDFGTEVP